MTFRKILSGWPMFVIGTVAILLRFATHRWTPLLLTPDSIAYYQMALDWRDQASWGQLLPFRTPVFPVVLGEVMRFGASPEGVTIFQALLGVLTVILITGLGCQFYGRRLGWIPGLIAAFYPPLIFFENYLMTETLVTFWIVLWTWIAWAYSQQPKGIIWAWLALLGGLIMLTRPSLLGFALAPLLTFVFRKWRGSPVRVVRLGAIYIAFLFFLMSPWLLYVYRTTNRVTLLPVTGTQLWIYQHMDGVFNDNIPGFSPYREHYRQFKAADSSQMSGWRIRTEILSDRIYSIAEADQIFMNYALESIRSDPLKYGQAVGRGLLYFFGFMDNGQDEAAAYLHDSLTTRAGRLAITQWAVSSVGVSLPDDSRNYLSWPTLNIWIAKAADVMRYRGFVLTPLFFLGVLRLRARSGYTLWSETILGAVLLVAVSHAFYLANLDRYHWVLEPVMWLTAIGALISGRSTV